MQIGVKKMAMKKKPFRMTLTLIEEQAEKLNNYIVNVAKKQGRIPHAIQTKLSRWAIEEWLERHGEDFDIDWDSRD